MKAKKILTAVLLGFVAVSVVFAIVKETTKGRPSEQMEVERPASKEAAYPAEGPPVKVVVFAVLIAFSAQSLGQAFKRLTQFELWARRITGTIFICIGIYYSLTHIFGII
ncbi:MAG: hypothetical protein KAJ01_08595 [Candidatus Hydrogenedentes bacterium]|nr:hypothetical protein [Candidatus Hydrogenedentota bacterium]